VKLRVVKVAALLVAAALLAYAGVALLAAGRPGAVAAGLEDEGRPVSAASLSAPLALRLSAETPAAVVLLDPAPAALGEADRLRSYVEEGGDLWILAPDPTVALWAGARESVHALPGILYASNASTPTFHLAGQAAIQPGVHALEIRAPWTARMDASAETFRDLTGDGRLETGEPSGPFVAAASLPVGRGTVTLVSLDAAREPVSASLLSLMARQMPPGRVLVQDAAAAPGWTAPGLVVERGLAILGATGVLATALVAAAALLGAALLAFAAVAADAPAREASSTAAARARAWLDALRERNPDQHARLVEPGAPNPGER
jgi:hypothetical protein